MPTQEGSLPRSPSPTVLEARAVLAAEWLSAAPCTDADVARFYQEACHLSADLDAWHATPERQAWTRMVIHVACEAHARTILDIGCGGGHDLAALALALIPTATDGVIRLLAVEPNTHLRASLHAAIEAYAEVASAPVADADLLLCIDVLEHIPHPEAFLDAIAQRAHIGCLLIEATATQDGGTPLHLAANRGWQPGRVLERTGWTCVDQAGRLRVWRRVALVGAERASVLLCAYRSLSVETASALLALTADYRGQWRVRIKGGDALIARSRSILATSWWRETADDVFLMIDDDVVFRPADADRLVELCRAGHDIICGAYPTHDGAHLACRTLPGTGVVEFSPTAAPLPIQYAATGFMAVHRRVLDALVPTLRLCHADQPWSFYPFFAAQTVEGSGGTEWLSEDYGFCALAQAAGFGVWLDPRTRLVHLGRAEVSVANMAAIHAALQDA